MSKKTVKYVNSDLQFHEELTNAGIRLAVVYFSGYWCGPCEKLDPEFEKLPQKYPRAVFIKVDVEKCFDTVAELEISVIPTFILYRNKGKIDRLRGAFLEVLEARIKEHIGSGESEAIQELIPQISYASTSTELSDKSRFEYFSRVVPPDNFQAQAMVELLKTLGWRYVSTVAVEGDYGEKGIASFISIAHDLGICVAVSGKVSRHSKPNDFDRIIERLSQKPQARAVVMFVDEDNTRKLLLASIRTNKTGHFYWVGSDSWGAKVHPVRDHEYAAVNAITILPHKTSLSGFDEYYARLKPTLDRKQCTDFGVNIPFGDSNKLRLNCRNIWFNDYWSQHHRCSLNRNDENACTGNETMGPYEQEALVPFVGKL